jgi:hypothetical protein
MSQQDVKLFKAFLEKNECKYNELDTLCKKFPNIIHIFSLLYVGFGSGKMMLIRHRLDPDPQHCIFVYLLTNIGSQVRIHVLYKSAKSVF